eukprot:GHVT01054645.1.p1 GENE.GHVT01054645.1~~GHVT01054645.1.p1  ORF type:complete len:299 (-),score=0.05 GHVT01054645.1:200-1096(-)
MSSFGRLRREIHSAALLDARLQVEDNAKKSAIRTAQDYHHFRNLVATCHLKPVSRNDIVAGASSAINRSSCSSPMTFPDPVWSWGGFAKSPVNSISTVLNFDNDHNLACPRSVEYTYVAFKRLWQNNPTTVARCRLLIVVSDTSWRKIVATSLDSQLFLEVLEAVCDIPKFLGKSAPEHYSYLADDLSSAFGSNDAAALKSTVTFEPTADSGVTCVSQMKQDVTCTCPCDDLPHVVTALQILMSSPCTKSLMLFLSPSERNRVRTMPNRLMALSDCFIEETPQKTSVEFSRKTLASLM